MRTKTLLTAVVIMLGLTVSAYAQTVEISASPVDTGRASGIAELVGRVQIGHSSGTLVTDTFTFQYGGATITNTTTTGITVTPNLVGAGSNATFVSISGDTVTVSMNGGGTSGNFELSGVRVALSEISGSSLSVSVGTLSTGNLITGANTSQVLNSIVEIKTVDNDGEASILTTGDLVDSTAGITIDEVSKANFATLAQEGGTPGATNGLEFELKLSEDLPAGLTLTVSSGTDTDSSLTVTFDDAVFDEDNDDVQVTVTASDQSTVEELDLDMVLAKLTGSSAPSLPLTPASISVTADVEPVGTVPSSGAASDRPAFISDPMDGGVVVQIVSSSTSLLFAFATWQPSLGFDSGVAIANTSEDRYTVGSATASSGTIAFHLFPADGSTGVTWETPASTAAGATYQALVSEIAGGAGLTSFTGYIIAVCNFTHAHGEGFVLDAGKIAQTLNATVILNPSVVDRDNAIADGGERNGR